MRFNISFRLFLMLAVVVATATYALAVPVTGGTGPGGFELANVSSDLTLWLDADSVTGVTSGNLLDTWTDRSGKANNATQTGSRRPTWNDVQQNGRAVVNFDGAQDGTGDFMQLGTADLFDLSTSDGFSFFSMTQLTGFPGGGSSTFPVILSARSGVTSQMQFLRSNNGSYDDFSIGSNSSTDVRANSSDFQVSAFQFIGGSYNGAGVGTNSNFAISADGNSQTIIGSGGFPDNNSVSNSRIGVETTTRNDQLWVGDMAEIVVFDRQLDSVETVLVNNYLSSKYNVAFNAAASGDDHYAGDTGANGDYDRDVFGVGNDAPDSVLISGSEGLGFEATAGLDDGDFLLAGHRVESNGLTSADVPAGEELRWQRVWYLDETDQGDDLATTLAFDFSDAGLNDPGLILSARLLYSSGQGPFSFSNLLSATSISGDLVTFNLPANLLLDGYYTLAFTAQPIPEPSSLMLLGLGVVGLAFQRRKRRASGWAIAQSATKSSEVSNVANLGNRAPGTRAPLANSIASFLALVSICWAASRTDAATISNYELTVLSQNPVAYWRANETSGTTAVDASPNGNDATYINTPSLGEPGPRPSTFNGFTSSNNAPGFDGATDQRANTTLSGLGLTYSVSLWVRNDRAVNAQAITGYAFSRSDGTGAGSASTADNFGINGTAACCGSNGSVMVFNGASAFVSSATITDNDWHHIALTRSGTSVSIFVDGAPAGSGTLAQTFASANGVITVGTRSDLFADWLGNLDEVAVFDRVLLASEISAQYESGLTEFTLIPEPSSFLLLGLGLIGLAGRRRRRTQ